MDDARENVTDDVGATLSDDDIVTERGESSTWATADTDADDQDTDADDADQDADADDAGL